MTIAPDFDTVIERRGTLSAKWDMMQPIYGVPAADGIAMWVADMDFRPPACVQAAIEEEQRLRIEASVTAAVGELMQTAGIKPSIIVKAGDPVEVVRAYVGTREDVAALVLGAAPSGSPGPIVTDFTGSDAGKLPCPVMIIPGALSDEAIDKLS